MANNKSSQSFVPPPSHFGGGFGRRGAPVVKPKNLKGTLWRLWKMVSGERKGLGIVFLLSGLASVSAIASPYFVGRVIDSISIGNLSLNALLILLLFYLCDSGVRLSQGWLMASVSQRMVRTIRKILFGKLNTLPLSFFDTHLHGDLMSRLTNDIDNISTTISDSVTQLMMLCFTLAGVLTMMILLNGWMTLAALITTPLILILTYLVTKHTRPLFKEQQITLGRLNGHVEESISGLMVVKAFCREEEVIREFDQVNNRLCDVGIKAQIWSGYLMPIMNVINNLSFISVAVTGGFLATADMITVGMISSFLLYARQLTRPLTDIANIYNTLQTAVAGAERVFEILDRTPEPQDLPDAQNITAPRGEVVFEDVHFGYLAETEVLRGISFQAPAGSKVAIVGSTGAGKTTIISLLARFYDVTKGRILLDGVDLRHYKRKDLRRCFGIVLQDAALFHMSVADNIRYGREDATMEDVITAAITANADPFIRRLPNGYDTILGEGGGSLSQGERQLITIARAILADAPILVLDEATSSVDTRTEQHIRDAMLTLLGSRTSFIIAHRLSTIRDSDFIILLEHGQIAEAGTHEELLELGGIYSRMYRTQTCAG